MLMLCGKTKSPGIFFLYGKIVDALIPFILAQNNRDTICIGVAAARLSEYVCRENVLMDEIKRITKYIQ